MIKIIYSAKNFIILKYNDTYICYSYGKKIAEYTNKLTIYNSKIVTQKNKCHLKIFKKTLDNYNIIYYN